MAQNSFDFFAKEGTDPYVNGSQVEHSTLTNAISTGDTYCRSWAGNTQPVKVLLTGSDFRALDGTRAVSLRMKMRVDGTSAQINYHNVWLVAKTSGSSLDMGNKNAPWSHVGYIVGIRENGDGMFGANNGTTKLSGGLHLINGLDYTEDGVPGYNTWNHFRMDVEPISSSTEGITGDQIRIYTSTDDGASWQNLENITLTDTNYGLIGWENTDNNRYGFIASRGVYVDDFQIFLSEES